MTDSKLISTLLIFAKPPRMGLAKTRLAKDIGHVEAQRLNRLCHARAMRAARGGAWSTVLSVAPDAMVNSNNGGLWPIQFPRHRQGVGDLGQRLARAFKTAPPGPIVVIGTDVADIGAHHIAQAFKALNGKDAVFGPADDGGFWLFGISQSMRRYNLRFNPVRWSTQNAMSDLVSTLPKQTRISCLEKLIDLDDASALMSWKNQRR